MNVNLIREQIEDSIFMLELVRGYLDNTALTENKLKRRLESQFTELWNTLMDAENEFSPKDVEVEKVLENVRKHITKEK